MTIGIIEPRRRSTVVWVGGAASATTKSLLESLRFFVYDSPSALDLQKDSLLAGTAAAVFVQSELKPLAILPELSTHVERLLDYGCLVFVLATRAGRASIINELRRLAIPSAWQQDDDSKAHDTFVEFDGRSKGVSSGDPLSLPHVRVYRNRTWAEEDIVNLVVRFGPGNPLAPKLRVEPRTVDGPLGNLKPAHRLMLRRSFFDCSEVHLNEITDGKSGLRVFLAHAKPAQALLERRLAPFFVKLGYRDKIVREWQNYNNRVHNYVPFHLAPSLVAERCAVGARQGIIVGDFVEDSEPLSACTHGGRAHTSISSLLDRTLRAWHLHGDKKNLQLVDSALPWLKRGEVPVTRLRRAKNAGARREPDVIVSELRAMPKEEFRFGPIHGDLHAGNVQVRGPDAILIDFYSSRHGPLLADPAALEVSLVVRIPHEIGFNGKAWKATVDELFRKEALETPPRFHNPTEPYSWLTSSVRQIRLHALSMELRPGQYADVLAYYMFCAATRDPEGAPGDEYRRTVAYYLVDKLLDIKWK